MKFYFFSAISLLVSMVSSTAVVKITSDSGSYDSCPPSVASFSTLGSVGADLNDAAVANGIIPPGVSLYDTADPKTRLLRSNNGDGDRQLGSWCGWCNGLCFTYATCYTFGCYTCRRMLTTEDTKSDGATFNEETNGRSLAANKCHPLVAQATRSLKKTISMQRKLNTTSSSSCVDFLESMTVECVAV